jgi:hypothetical protein
MNRSLNNRYAPLMAGILVLLGVVALVACTAKPTSETKTVKTVTEHVRVDDAVIDKGDPYEIIDPVWWMGNIYEGEQKYTQSLAPFSREQRLLFAVAWYVAEVNNGGHDQFYSNSTGIVWKDALAGFKELGVGEAAAIIQESAARMGGLPSMDRDTRQKQLDTYEPDFSDLDTRFYALEETGNINEAMRQYILQHRGSFHFEGDVKRPKL